MTETPEKALSDFNAALKTASTPPLAAEIPPILFICGAPRSGTTFVSQCVIHGGDLGCVNNVVARFIANPVLGVRFFQALALEPVFSGVSEYGRTHELTQPHEFGRGWLKMLGASSLTQPAGPIDLPSDAIPQINDIARAFEKPTAFKSFAYLWFIEALSQAIPSSLWLHIEREETANVASLSRLYDVRGSADDPEAWESAVCQKTMATSGGLPLSERCSHQIRDINDHIKNAVSGLPERRKLSMAFSDFTENPQQSTRNILDHFGLPISHGHILDLPQ